jgi:hypothetical protein
MRLFFLKLVLRVINPENTFWQYQVKVHGVINSSALQIFLVRKVLVEANVSLSFFLFIRENIYFQLN